jgi:hypothetical protein
LDPSQEAQNVPGHLVTLGFECEMSGVDEVDFSLGVIALVGFGARRQEEGIVLAPDGSPDPNQRD